MRLRPSRTTAATLTALLGLAALTAGCGTTKTPSTRTSGADSSVASPASRGSAAAAQVPSQLQFTTTTVDGKTFKGSSLAGKDAVLWFWAPWCTVCKGEAPTVARTAEKWRGKVTFVGVPGLGATSDMKRFIADTGLGGMQQAVDTDGSLWARFGVPAQPATAFVNNEGKVKVTMGTLTGAQFDDEVKRLTQR
nr:redoxin domain-containing protein [Streptomyces sp. NBRC 110030]